MIGCCSGFLDSGFLGSGGVEGQRPSSRYMTHREHEVKESPIFIKTYEMMVWVLEHTAKFPKNQRFLLARRIEDAVLDLYEKLNQAALAKEKQGGPALHAADAVLANLKLYNRLAKDLKLLAFNQYEYLAIKLDEIGRLLGGWRRRLKHAARPAATD